MKKKIDPNEKPEIIDNPITRIQEIKQINEELSKLMNLELTLKGKFNLILQTLSEEISHDNELKRKDTLKLLKIYFDKLINEFKNFKDLNSVLREKLYYLIYNISIVLYEYTVKMRKTNFSIHASKYLTWIISLIESNVILSGIKYLDWKIKLYCELAFCYEDIGAYNSSYKVIIQAINKLNELKSVEEQQQPTPDFIKQILRDNEKKVKLLENKYSLMSNSVNIDSWKKKIEEINNEEKEYKYLCIINTLSSLSKFNNIVMHEGLKSPWKSQLCQYVYDLLKNEIITIKTGILDLIEKKKKEREKEKKIKENQINYQTIIEQYHEFDEKIVKKNIWKKISQFLPIEIHMDLIRVCYDCKLWKEFLDLMDSMLIRIKYRRIEQPYLSEIDVQVSSIQYSNIPNKFEKIPIDLNVNNYRNQIKILTEQGKYLPGQKKQESEQKTKNSNDKKNTKKVEVPATVENPYEEIEGLDHQFIYLLLKRTHNPQKAITEIRIEKSNNKIDLGDNEKAIEIPLKIINGASDKAKSIPILIYKKTSCGLKNEGEKLQAITNLMPFISSSDFINPPAGYKKIPFELTNFQNINNTNFSHNFVFIGVKNDESYLIIEKEYQIMKNLYELEMSYVEKSLNEYNSLKREEKFLNLNYNLEKLEILSKSLFSNSLGPLGIFFLKDKKNFFYDICVLIWNKYLKDQLNRIDYYSDIENELEETEKNEIKTKLIEIRECLYRILSSLHSVLSKIEIKDVILYTYVSLRLADFAESCEQYELGANSIQSTLDFINQYKENIFKFGVDNSLSYSAFVSFTCDNNKIANLINSNKEKTESLIKFLNQKRRKQYRINKGLSKLSNEEEFEEDFEMNLFEKEFKEKFLKSNPEFNNNYDNKKYFLSESDNLLNCLFVDLCFKYYRLYNKSGFINKQNIKEKKLEDSKSSEKTTKLKISEKKMKKLELIKGKTAETVKSNMDFLKNSLQEAGKMDPDKPNFEKYEKEKLLEISRNIYLKCLYKTIMAFFRNNKQDQKYLLVEALDLFKKLINEENERFKYYEDNFFYLKASEFINKNLLYNQSTFYPYNLLYKKIMVDNLDKIPEPILIHKTQSTATFLFPPAKIRKNNLEEKYHYIKKICLFGQQSTGTNIVALHNKGLNGTGIIIDHLNYQTVKNLKQNEKHIFAYAGYDSDNVIIGQIGATCKEVENYFPLPITSIGYYLSKISYENEHYEIAKEVSKIVFNNFTEKSEIRDFNYDNKNMSVIFYKLKYNSIKNTCNLELEHASYCFYLFAKSLYITKYSDHNDSQGIYIFNKQKNIIKNINVLMLGLEISSYIRNYPLIKLFTEQIFSFLFPLINQKTKTLNLINPLIRSSLSICLIPNTIWDTKLRRLSSLIDYQVLLHLINNNESDGFKKLLSQEIGLDKRKFLLFNYKYLKKIEDPKKKQLTEKEKKMLTNLPKEEEKFEERSAYLIKEIEKETSELDDFIISLYDFNEIMRTKINQYHTIKIRTCVKLDNKYINIKEATDELEKRKKDINDTFEIWESIKNEGVSFLKKFATSNRDTERYYETSSLLIKRAVDISKTNNIQEITRMLDDFVIKETDSIFIDEIFKQKLNFLNSDIVYSMKKRIRDFLSSVGNQIKENQSTIENNKDISLDQIRLKIEEKYFGSSIENEKTVPYENLQTNEVYLLKEKYFWISELLFQKSNAYFNDFIASHPTYLNYEFNNFLNYKLIDIQKIKKFAIEDKEFIEYRVQEDKTKDMRIKQLSKIFEKLSYLSQFQKEIHSFVCLDNTIILSYNILTFEMMSPYDCLKENLLNYLFVIAENAIFRMNEIKFGDNEYKQLDYIQELQKLKERLNNTQGIKTLSNFDFPKKNNLQSKGEKMIDDEFLIDNYKKQINFDAYYQIICFTILCIYTSEKWNILADLIQKFNDATCEFFADFTFPFLIEAQNKLFEKSKSNSTLKKNEVQQRVTEYETWKNSKKKNKRQMLITGETPQEQLDFERDYSILSKELFILEKIENLLRTDKEISEKKLSALLNDSNNCSKTLFSCRKLVEKYQMESILLETEESLKGKDHFDVKSKKKALKLFASSIISNYKKAIQILKKRQENYLLIQSLFEMSIIYYSDEDIKSAETYFNEALDTVFQKLYSLKEYRILFENTKNVAEKYLIKPLLYSIIILHKLAKFCYDNDLYKQRESCLMASEIVYHILSQTLPTPFNILNFSIFRLNEIHKNFKCFDYLDNVKPSYLIESCIDMTEILISYSDFEKCLPLICLQEYLSIDICKSTNYLLKSRIQKIICCAELGLINESMQNFMKVIKKLDLPNIIPNSIFSDKNNGKFFNIQKEIKYFNNQTPDFSKNIDTITMFSKLNPDVELKNLLGNSYYNELIYSRSLIIFKIFEKENYLNYYEITKSDNRQEYFMRIESYLRDILQSIAINEELVNLTNHLNNLKKIKSNKKDEMDWFQRKIDEIVTNNRFMQEEINFFYLPKFNKREIDLRSERLELIIKVRNLLSRIQFCQSNYLASQGILLKLLTNIKFYSSNKILNIENKEDYSFEFKLTDPSQAKLNKANVAAEKKLDNKNKKDLPALNINLDEEINKIFESKYDISIRCHGNSINWLKTLYLITLNYLKMNRLEDCLKIIEQCKNISKSVNDIFFNIRLKEIEIYISIIKYDLDKINEVDNEIKNISKSFFINEFEYSIFLTNYSEFLNKIGKNDESIIQIKEARKIAWTKISKLNYSLTNQNYSDINFTKGLEIDKDLKQILSEREVGVTIQLAGKKPQDNAKKNEPKSEIMPIEYNIIYNFSEKASLKSFDNISDLNNSDEGPNLYFKFNEILARIDLKYCLFLINSQNPDYGLIENIMSDVEILSSKLLYPHNSLFVLINFIMGKLCIMKFLKNLSDFYQEKLNKIIKKYKIETLRVELFQKYSNYWNEKCVNTWIPLLLKSKDYFEKSIKYIKSEFYTIEYGINLHDIILSISNVCLYLAEFKPIKTPKFCDFNQIVLKVYQVLRAKKYYDSEKDELPYLNDSDLENSVINEKKNWIEDRNKQDLISYLNYLKESIYYIDLSIILINKKKYINDNSQELTPVKLIDPNKIPKDISNLLFEYDYLNKKKNKNYLTNISIKPEIETSDILYFLRYLMKETEFLTFLNDENLKNLSKIHKYLKGNCANYNSKVYYEINPYVESTDINTEIIKKDQIYCFWIPDYESMIFNYILGGNSALTEFNNFVFGRVSFNKGKLLAIHKSFFELRNTYKITLTYTEQRKIRDLKYLQKEFNKLVLLFSQEFLNKREIYRDFHNLESSISKDNIGEIKQEYLDNIINLISLPAMNFTNQKQNALFNELNHKLFT